MLQRDWLDLEAVRDAPVDSTSDASRVVVNGLAAVRPNEIEERQGQSGNSCRGALGNDKVDDAVAKVQELQKRAKGAADPNFPQRLRQIQPHRRVSLMVNRLYPDKWLDGTKIGA